MAQRIRGIADLTLPRSVGGPIRRPEQIVGVLSDRFPEPTSGSELGSSRQEFEVLDVIVTGTLSDKDIADALYISLATAVTQVRHERRHPCRLSCGHRQGR